MKKLVSGLLVNLALLAAPFVLLEGAFRLLPVAYLPPIQPVSAEKPVVHFQPNVDYRYSRDWNFSVVTQKHSNNYGFIHSADYRPEERTPLMAVIGDSLIEGNHVDNGKSVSELLHAKLAGQGRVYSLAISGAPLSQYMVYADFARQSFRPQALAVVVAPNDFDESLLKYKSEPRFHYFRDDGTLERVDYELSGTRRILRHSAVLRYAMQNLDAGLRVQALLSGERKAAGDAEQALERRIADSRRAVEFFLEQLPAKSGLAPGAILFVMDPLRPAVYSDEKRAETERGFYGRIARHFMAEARKRGYEVLDLEPKMLERYRRDGTRFEVTSTDSHWSAFAHGFVAAEIEKSAVFRRTFDGLKTVTARGTH